MANETSFPLCWPVGWKRAKYRARAKFGKDKATRSGDQTFVNRDRLTIADGVRRTLEALRRMGVSETNTIVSSNVRPRLDGLPSSSGGEPPDPGVAVYWKNYRKEQRCMAIDKYNRVADNLAAIAATLEAMRAIERHGGAEILDRAFLGFQAIMPPGSAEWKTILGNPKNREEAESVYRSLAQIHHPDKGGNVDEFSRINNAIRAAREAL